jgi:UrcA family protein
MKTTTQKNGKGVMLAMVAAMGIASAMGAHADATATDVPTRTVHYADLNLNTDAGAAILFKRIRNAAEAVCGDVSSKRLEVAEAAKACVNQAMFHSVQAVNNPKLTNEYNARFGVAKLINVAAR